MRLRSDPRVDDGSSDEASVASSADVPSPVSRMALNEAVVRSRLDVGPGGRIPTGASLEASSIDVSGQLSRNSPKDAGVRLRFTRGDCIPNGPSVVVADAE